MNENKLFVNIGLVGVTYLPKRSSLRFLNSAQSFKPPGVTFIASPLNSLYVSQCSTNNFFVRFCLCTEKTSKYTLYNTITVKEVYLDETCYNIRLFLFSLLINDKQLQQRKLDSSDFSFIICSLKYKLYLICAYLGNNVQVEGKCIISVSSQRVFLF